MSGVTKDALIDYLRDQGGKVSYDGLRHKFAFFLNDPVNGKANKLQFKEVLKKVATFSIYDNGDRIIALKETLRENNRAETPKSTADDSSGSIHIPVPKKTVFSTSKDSGFSQTLSQAVPLSERRVSPVSVDLPMPDGVSATQHKKWLVAISKCDIDSIKALLAENPDILEDTDNSIGYTAFHWAAASGNCEAIEYLSFKADSTDLINRINRSGYTPLHIAYIHNRIAAAQVLEKNGADRFAEDFDCNQPVHYCQSSNTFSGSNQAAFSPSQSIGRQKISTLERVGRYGSEIASKICDKVRSISSSSSVESIPSSVCSTNSHKRRGGSGFLNRVNSNKNNCYLEVRSDPRFLRGLSSSSGTLYCGMQLTPELAHSHVHRQKAKSTDISPPLQELRRKSAELMPPPPRPPLNTRLNINLK